MSVHDLFRGHKETLIEAAKESPFIVFLCGPTLNAAPPKPSSTFQERLKKWIVGKLWNGSVSKPSSNLRRKLKEQLEGEGFDVVLGEDDGLEDARLDLGINAQDNELEFIRRHCNAVIVIADSVGAFCELGLFSWHFVHENGVIKNGSSNTDFIVLVDRQYERDKSYLNEGPVNAVLGFGQAHFVDFDTYAADEIIRRFRSRRGVLTIDRRGRPPKGGGT